MAETKKKVPEDRKIVSASTGQEVTDSEVKKTKKQTESAAKAATATAEDKKKAKNQRILAVVLWILGLGMEVLAYLFLIDYFHLASTFIFCIVALAIDLVLVVIGSQLWKKANHVDPASKKNKVKFWLWNNLGVIASLLAFLPFIILVLLNKDLDGKSKRLAAIVAIVALLISGASSYDWNPVSQEDALAAAAAAGGGSVYWTQYGKKYHIYDDCSSLTRSSTLFQGTVDEAFESGRDSLCKICERRAIEDGHLYNDNTILIPGAGDEEAA